MLQVTATSEWAVASNLSTFLGERNFLSGNRTTFPLDSFTTCSKFSPGGWVTISFQLTTFVTSACYAIAGEQCNQNRIRYVNKGGCVVFGSTVGSDCCRPPQYLRSRYIVLHFGCACEGAALCWRPASPRAFFLFLFCCPFALSLQPS